MTNIIDKTMRRFEKAKSVKGFPPDRIFPSVNEMLEFLQAVDDVLLAAAALQAQNEKLLAQQRSMSV
jgi:hypothetical protein